MAKAQFNNRQKNISRVIRTQRINSRDKLRAMGKPKGLPLASAHFQPQK